MRFQFPESPEQEVKAMSYVNTLRTMNPNATEFNHLIQLFAAVHDNSCLYVISQFCRYVRTYFVSACLVACLPACLPACLLVCWPSYVFTGCCAFSVLWLLSSLTTCRSLPHFIRTSSSYYFPSLTLLTILLTYSTYFLTTHCKSHGHLLSLLFLTPYFILSSSFLSSNLILYFIPFSLSYFDHAFFCYASLGTICLSNGACKYSDPSGNILPVCSIFDVRCSVSCTCSNGSGGRDCSLNSTVLAARNDIR